jgi:hypothetical protein
MSIFGGGKKDDRPIDVGLAALSGKSEAELIEWWKQRLTLITQIPNETARVGALTPQLRELSRISSEEERRKLTRARIIAFAQLPAESRQALGEARTRAWDVDRGVLEADQKVVDQLLPTMDQNIRAAYPAPKQ